MECSAFNWRFIVAEKIDVEVTGKSKYEVAHQMAVQILTAIEKKKWEQVSRQEYLEAHSQAVAGLDRYYI